MLAITCDKCRRRFTLSAQEVATYATESEGKRHAMILCQHCGKGIKVDRQRLQAASHIVGMEIEQPQSDEAEGGSEG